MKRKKVMKLASRGKRLGAYCIDAVIPLIIGVLTVIFIIAAMYRTMSFYNNPFYGYGYGYGYGHGGGLYNNTGSLLAVIIILSGIYIGLQIYCFTRSATIGKAALKLQVVSSTTGKPIGFWNMLLREWIVKKASACIFCLGYIWICIDDKNRGWHDKILDTYVVDLRETSKLSYRPPAPAGYLENTADNGEKQDE